MEVAHYTVLPFKALLYSQSCVATTTVSREHLYCSQKNLISSSRHSLLPPWVWATINLLSVFMDLPTVDISYKWSFMVSGLSA